MGKQITIQFRAMFRGPMMTGIKSQTARTRWYGHPGAWFEAWGQRFEIVSICKEPLRDVMNEWREEGCASAAHFVEVWTTIHPNKPLNFDQVLNVHRFRWLPPERKAGACAEGGRMSALSVVEGLHVHAVDTPLLHQ